MLRFVVRKGNGTVFYLKAVPHPVKEEVYLLWYKERGLLKRWQFIDKSATSANIELTILDYFGFLSMVQRLK